MIQMKENDRRPVAYTVLKRGESIVDLTDAASVTFRMRPISRVDMKVVAAAVVVGVATGEVEYRWAVGDTDTPGTFLATWRVIWSDGTPETFPTIDFDVVEIHGNLDGS